MPGAQPGLVPSDACHVTGEQWFGGGAEWNQEPAREAGVNHEAGDKPVCTADWAQRTGISCDSQLTPSFCNTPSSFSVCVFFFLIQSFLQPILNSSFYTLYCLHLHFWLAFVCTLLRNQGENVISHMLACLQSCENRKLSQDSKQSCENPNKPCDSIACRTTYNNNILK